MTADEAIHAILDSYERAAARWRDLARTERRCAVATLVCTLALTVLQIAIVVLCARPAWTKPGWFLPLLFAAFTLMEFRETRQSLRMADDCDRERLQASLRFAEARARDAQRLDNPMRPP
jgi:hypothetical protein